MNQLTFSDIEYSNRKKTRRDPEMHQTKKGKWIISDVNGNGGDGNGWIHNNTSTDLKGVSNEKRGVFRTVENII